MDFRHYTNLDDVIIPSSVEDKIAALNLRLKDILWTLNFPMRQRQYPERKYRKERWFGAYWTGLYCKWSEQEGKWVILTCWRDDVVQIT